MLEDHADAELAGKGRVGYGDGLDRARSSVPRRAERAIEHFDEGGFARAVFPQKGVDFARPDVEIDRVIGLERPKGFGQPAQRQKDIGGVILHMRHV